ncbi:AraC family transcriptional regulator [Paenibacillus sp. JX-17]|uniref:AraC family transcriptional regulator n=1 Tax=Paenibacillus lacisoli TaxID=3064525 RepID=A0ABT9CH69_9BACL|nr:AraC family transcriptional regulator [Paenibacillus sp. JX-17]MDO7907989.1 AraC family transcriptional regulator [Paenibacillus sp. JX-17]
MPDLMRFDPPVIYNYRSSQPLTASSQDGFHSHVQYEVYYFHEGSCRYIIGEQLHHLRPGDVLLMHGRTLHRAYPENGLPYVRSTLHFDPDLLRNYIQEHYCREILMPFEQLGNCRVSFLPEERAGLESMLSELAAWKAESQARVPLRFILQICDLLAMLADRCLQDDRAERKTVKEQYVQYILDYIEQHFMEDIVLDDIAEHLHLSKSYLVSIFKERTGTTVFKYLYHRRINQAKLILQFQPELTITEVSQLAGFKQLAHFSRMFKQATGSSPEAYRQLRSSSSW